jgi:uncharacterized RmlC-like cupin family protein
MIRAVPLLLPVAIYAQSTTVVDNSSVRIIHAVDRPHAPSPLHRHDFGRVMVYLDAGDQDITAEGRVEHHHWKAGEVVWSPVGPAHVSENVGAADLRIVEIEIKRPAPSSPPKRNPKLDPLTADRAHNTFLFENDQVRVYLNKIPPGAREKWHEHVGAGRAIVLLAPLAARVEEANGEVSPMNGAAGDALWRQGAVKHRGSNIGARPSEMVIVEVK